jgi:hypothetical protein
MKHPLATAALAALVALSAVAACGPPPKHGRHARSLASDDGDRGDDRPRTHDAARRARDEAQASGEEPVSSQGKHWGGWRYQGRRDDCFFVVGRRCFDDEKRACAAARCRSHRCKITGGGPATVTCEK